MVAILVCAAQQTTDIKLSKDIRSLSLLIKALYFGGGEVQLIPTKIKIASAKNNLHKYLSPQGTKDRSHEQKLTRVVHFVTQVAKQTRQMFQCGQLN